MNVVFELMFTQPAPLAIWATLLLAATGAVALLAGIDGHRQPHPHLLDAVPVLRRLRAERDQRRRDAEHTVRYADELTVAAQRAVRAAGQWREHAQQAEEHTATAWQAWQDAEQRLIDSYAASPFTAPAPAVEQERAVQQAAAHRLRLYRQAARTEKATRHHAELAHATRDSLRHQATVAIAEAIAVRHLTPEPRPGPEARARHAVLAAA